MPEPAEPTASIRALRAEILAALGPKVAGVAPDVSKLAASFAYGEVWPRRRHRQRRNPPLTPDSHRP